ncbi:MAG: P-loop NTPase fold protein [Ignavibacteria bacterium]
MEQNSTAEIPGRRYQIVSPDETHINDTNIYYNDSPLTTPEFDRFERYPFADKISQAVSSRRSPGSVVMAVYGSWGEGKTTVLNFIELALRKHNNIVSVPFNPWQFHNEFQIIKGFFNAFTEAIEKTHTFSSMDIIPALNEYAGILIRNNNAALSGQPQNISDKATWGFNAGNLNKLRSKIEKILEAQKIRFVFLTDDLDKLEKHQLKAILKLIKLTANFPFTLYITTFDENLVASNLAGNAVTNQLNAGKKFLEKMVQISLHIPACNKLALEKFCLECVNSVLSENNIEISREEFKDYLRSFKNGLSIKFSSPRSCKNYRNALSFALNDLNENVNVIDFMIIEGIRLFFPLLYNLIRTHPHIFQGIENPNEIKSDDRNKLSVELVEKAVADQNPEERKAAKYLLCSLFPSMKPLFAGQFPGLIKRKADKDSQSISSKNNFSQYFTYFKSKINPTEDDLEYLISLLDFEDPGFISVKIEEIVKNTGSGEFLQKLEPKVTALNETSGAVLISSLDKTGKSFINPGTLFSFTTIFSHPGIIIRRLLDKLSDKVQAFELASELVLKSEPISFAFECYRWMQGVEEEDSVLFEKHEEEKLGQLMAHRIALYAQNVPLYIVSPEDTPFLLSVWSYLGGKEETSKYLQGTFEQEQGNIMKFLKCYLPEELNLKKPLSEYTFGREQFNLISSVVDHKVVFDSLFNSMGEDILRNVPVAHSSFESLIAEKFVDFYKKNGLNKTILPLLKTIEDTNSGTYPGSRGGLTIVSKGV